MVSKVVYGRARAYSKERLLPTHRDEPPERKWSPRRLNWRWRSLRRRELYLIVILGLTYYSWSVERMWDQEWTGWKEAAGRDRETDLEAASIDMAYSHNDEMQGTDALTLALSLGFGAIEVDTWLTDLPHGNQTERASYEEDGSSRGAVSDPTQGLVIGHKQQDLAGRMLSSVYLDPLRKILDDRNAGRNQSTDWVGVHAQSPKSEVQLVIDFKSDGETMWPYVLAALEPLLSAGYLTTYNVSSSTWNTRPLRIIGTGNTPLSRVYHSPLRYIFYDAHLLSLSKDSSIPASAAGPAATFDLTPEIAPMASGKFPILYHLGAVMPPWSVVQRFLGGYTAEARNRGIQSRWWGSARYPAFLRRRLWMMMQKAGVDWVGGDDLADLAGFMKRL